MMRAFGLTMMLLGVFAVSGVSASEFSGHEGRQIVLVSGASVNVTKTCPQWPVLSGYTLHFRATVFNGGSVPLTNVRVTDAMVPDCDRVVAALAPGQSVSWNCSRSTVIADDSFTSLLNAFATPPSGADVRGVSFCTAVLLKPRLVVEQTCPPTQVFAPGESMTFSVTVRNLGGTKINNVLVTAPLAPDCARNFGTIDSFASTSYTCQKVAGAANETVTVAVSGTTPTGEQLAYDRSCPVTVAAPVSSVQVVKNCPPGEMHANSLVTYTITVTNNGGTTLTAVTTSDPLAPACSRVIGTMAPNAVHTYTCAALCGGQSFVNQVSVSATTPDSQTVSNSGSCGVAVEEPVPSIQVVKSCPAQQLPNGATATFSITVTNTGNAPLSAVSTTDPLVPACSRTIGELLPGASSSYTCETTCNGSTTNVIQATGTAAGGVVVTDSDSCAVCNGSGNE